MIKEHRQAMIKNSKSVRLFALILAISMMFSLMLTATASDAEKRNPGYRVAGTYNQQTAVFTLSFYVYGLNACGGRIALDYDEALVQHVGGGSFRDSIKTASNIRKTTEGKNDSDLVSTEKGYVLFAWNPIGPAIDTLNKEYCIATVDFKLKDNVTTADFDKSTFRLQYVGSHSSRWETAAWLMDVQDGIFTNYSNCISYAGDCTTTFEYPGSDRISDKIHDVKLKILDSSGNPLVTDVRVNGETVACDSSGTASFSLANGYYRYKVSSPGYEEKAAAFSVQGSDLERIIYLAANRQLVQEARDKLKVGFAPGDSAANVTRALTLVTTGAHGCTVTWTSSVPGVIVSDGSVFPKDTETKVVLTAKIAKDGLSESKTFEVTVAPKGAPIPPTPPPTEEPGGKFEDLDSVPWAKEAIEALAEAGVIEGITETQYAPAAQIKRGDFVTLLMRMLKPEASPTEGFADVPKTSYYYEAITLAKSLGIAQGMEGNRFDPEGKISRQDMMVLTYRALVVLGYMQSDNTAQDALKDYTDKDSIADYAVDAVSNLVKIGYISGNGDNTLAPRSLTNRAEAAVFLYRIYMDVN